MRLFWEIKMAHKSNNAHQLLPEIKFEKRMHQIGCENKIEKHFQFSKCQFCEISLEKKGERKKCITNVYLLVLK